MSNQIVQVNVSVTEAPAPSRLQETGAMVTQGGTNTDAGTLSLLTSAESLDSIIASPISITGIAWSGSVATVTTSSDVPWGMGDVVEIFVAGVTPAGYNGKFEGTVTGADTVTYPLASDPGAVTVQGTIQLWAINELQQMVNTFFAQPSALNQSVYVLELGEGDPAVGPPLLNTFIQDNPRTIYSFLIPREWDAITPFLNILGDYDAPNACTYFFVTTTTDTFSGYATHKSVLCAVESPGVTVDEFSLAAEWAVTLNYDPSSTNQVTPLSYAFVYGVTPYPIPGNQALFTTLNNGNVGLFQIAAEGGLSNTMVTWGQMQDGNPFNFWYSADWAQLNIELNLANEVINGSNDPLAPLYYNQSGINRLENRTAQTLGTAVAYGLAIGTVKMFSMSADDFRTAYLSGQFEGLIAVNAEPFLTYTTENPDDYAIGRYAGLAVVYTPSRGFKQIIVDLNVTNIIGAP